MIKIANNKKYDIMIASNLKMHHIELIHHFKYNKLNFNNRIVLIYL